MPKRTNRNDDQGIGGDSFLDVVTNIVGILIILVMVVGMRAGRLPDPGGAADANPNDDELRQAEATAADLESDVLRLADEMESLAATTENRFAERAMLAQFVSQRQHDLDQSRQRMSVATREQFDLQRSVAAARSQLQELDEERLRQTAAKPTKIEIQNYPTPLSQTVFGKELHVQLRGGRVAPIPLDELIARFKQQAPQKVDRLRSQPELTETLGPIDGFRLRYTLERVDMPLDTQLRTGQGGSYVQLYEYTLIPVSSQLGETLADALRPTSQFLSELSRHDAGRTTVTLWTYPDSFDEFRALRKELYRLGYQVAGRPLPFGQPIGGSPQGSKSSAQ
jgi:hypothetical protein